VGQKAFLEGQEFCFYYVLIKIFLGTAQRKFWGELPPNISPWLRAWNLLSNVFILSTLSLDEWELFSLCMQQTESDQTK